MLLFCFVELQPVFTAQPPNTFFALEGNNIFLEWNYTVGGSLLRVEFINVFTNPVRIVTIAEIGDINSPFITPAYKGRLQVNSTDFETNIKFTLLKAKRTDSGNYQLNVVRNDLERASSSIKIEVQCK